MNYNILTISNVSLKPTTMKTQTIIQDYYGALSYINQNNDKELIIFIIDLICYFMIQNLLIFGIPLKN